jgi:hypothetical protein
MNIEIINQVGRLEGWLLSFQLGYDRYAIERDDEAMKFKSDREALTHVWSLAIAGSIIHEQAINFTRK